MKARFVWAGAAAVLLAVAIACGGSPTSPSGNFQILLKDSPFSDAKAVLVTFSEVSVHATGGGWTTIPFSGASSSRTCDLKKLQSAQDVLGVGTLAAGHYTGVRLTVSSAALYFDNASSGSACAAQIAAPGGNSAPITVPPGQVFLNREFDVPSTGATMMVLDFNGDQSIIKTGNGTYQMNPVINVVSVQ